MSNFFFFEKKFTLFKVGDNHFIGILEINPAQKFRRFIVEFSFFIEKRNNRQPLAHAERIVILSINDSRMHNACAFFGCDKIRGVYFECLFGFHR